MCLSRLGIIPSRVVIDFCKREKEKQPQVISLPGCADGRGRRVCPLIIMHSPLRSTPCFACSLLRFAGQEVKTKAMQDVGWLYGASFPALNLPLARSAPSPLAMYISCPRCGGKWPSCILASPTGSRLGRVVTSALSKRCSDPMISA